MRFQCHKCGAQWEGSEDSTTGLVQCPECFAVVPVSAASPQWRAGTPPPSKTSDTSIHELPTILESGLKSVPPRKDTPHRQVGSSLGERPVHRSKQIGAEAQALRNVVKHKHKSDIGESEHHGHDNTPSDVEQGADSPKGTTMENPHTVLLQEDPPTVIEADEKSRSVSKRSQFPLSRSPSQPRAAARTTGMAPTKGADLSGVTLGGYEIKSKLGAGGMGTVYLARQKSLDRDVALKILPAELAANPEFLVRFTREALSAAQLNHHNIVQVYDVGSEGDTHYISMEYVRGSNLAEIVRRDGRLQVEDGVSYALQAARALAYAHRRGFVHRDIKPENLLLNEHGLVKIADMGLAKLRGWGEADDSAGIDREAILKQAAADVTMPSVAMGTPAYMPPEQAIDAASVDHRADQYSLGCTLYYLIAGKPPFSGTTAHEIITKQRTEAPPPIDLYVRAMPPGLKKILERMLAKNPEDRFPDMEAVIHAFEDFLGLETDKGVFRPRETHLAELEECQAEYYAVPAIYVRRFAFLGFSIVPPLLGLLLFMFGAPRLGMSLFGGMLLTPPLHILLDGILHRSYLFRRCRSALFGMSWRSWLTSLALLVILAVLVWRSGIVGWLIVMTMLGIGFAAAFEFGIKRRLRSERSPTLERLRMLLKQLRLRGVSEEGLEDFVSRFAGPDWEEMFEDIFGYEALQHARARSLSLDKLERRRRYAAWRDPLIEWLDRLEERRRKARELRTLAKAEQKRLRAQGVAEAEATRRAQEAATVILTEIAQQHNTLYADPFAAERHKRHRHEAGSVAQLYRIVRGILGLACIVLFFYPYFSGMDVAASQSAVRTLVLSLFSDPLGWSLTNWLLISGIGLLFSALSARIIAPSFVTVGALGMAASAFAAPLVQKAVGAVSATAPQVQVILASPQYFFLALIGAGIGILLTLKILTGRF